MCFVDTNILIYAVGPTPTTGKASSGAGPACRERSGSLGTSPAGVLRTGDPRLTPGALTHDEAVAFTEALQRFRVQAITLDVMRAAFTIRERFGLSYWDSAILAAARECGCDAVYSEDLSDEQDYEGVRVINPFVGRPK